MGNFTMAQISIDATYRVSSYQHLSHIIIVVNQLLTASQRVSSSGLCAQKHIELFARIKNTERESINKFKVTA
jgi:hypothetical protein